jgi:hypothetical protein
VEEGAVDDVDELEMIEVDELTVVGLDDWLAIAVLLLMILDVLLDEAPLASRYQFSLGSPRHSPTVTGVYPRARRVLIMYEVRLTTVW